MGVRLAVAESFGCVRLNIMSTTTKITLPNQRQEARFVREVRQLLKELKSSIGDEYRASEEDTLPSMQVTVGATVADDGTVNWHYQTGDNSYSGGAYSHAWWGVISLYRRSNSLELATDIAEQILSAIAQS